MAHIVNNASIANGGLGGFTEFYATSRAGSAILDNLGSAFASGAEAIGGGQTFFYENSSAQTATITNQGATVSGAEGGSTQFLGSSTGGSAALTARGGTTSGAKGGEITFFNASSAGDARILATSGQVSGALGGRVRFSGTASAGASTITNHSSAVFGAAASVTSFEIGTTGGTANLIAEGATLPAGVSGLVNFFSATADASTLTVGSGSNGGAGGRIDFFGTSSGGVARAIFVGDGSSTSGALDISSLTSLGMDIGSIEGGGIVSLGSKNLAVGTNNLNTAFSGLIRDGGLDPGTGGTLTKTGTGTLVLSGVNIFTGATTVSSGILRVQGSLAGAVNVQGGGTLGGSGLFNGGITVGSGGVVAPGESIGAITALSTIAFGNGSVYGLEIDSSTDSSDRLAAAGVSIGTGVSLSGKEIGAGDLPAGQVFKIIDNTSADPTTGTFAGLAGNAEWTLGNNVFRISYQGGDGNDVTLTRTGSDAYWQWATATYGLSGDAAAGNADPDQDGLENFMEFVLGGEPNPANPDANSVALLPTRVLTATHLLFTYRRTDSAQNRPGSVIQAEYGSALTGWTAARDGVAGVTITVLDDGFGPGVDRVVVAIPLPPVLDARIFVRLSAGFP